jgi:hypothetical protein
MKCSTAQWPVRSYSNFVGSVSEAMMIAAKAATQRRIQELEVIC